MAAEPDIRTPAPIAAEAADAISLSMVPASAREWRRTSVALLATVIIFAILLPVANMRLQAFPEFNLIYGVALALINALTATFLISQYRVLRTRALLVLAGGYLFAAFIVIGHVLTFPSTLAPGGLLGSGPQIASWIYRVWHAGFPIAVIGYALIREPAAESRSGEGPAWPAILATAVVVAGLVFALILLAMRNEALLPLVIEDGRFTSIGVAINIGNWGLSFVALAALLFRRPSSVLDLWLMVVMGAFLADLGLAGVFGVSRFSVGWYSSRVFGLVAASLLLMVLLSETAWLYARLLRASAREREERDRKMREAQARIVELSHASALREMVSGLTREARQPLSALSVNLNDGDHLIRSGKTAELPAVLARAGEEAGRVGRIIDRIRDFVRREEITRRNEDLAAAIEEVAALALRTSELAATTLELRLHPDCGLASIDKEAIQQVLFILITNAIEAVRESSERRIVVRTQPTEEDMIAVSIADSGPGLAAAVRERPFEPFATTKPDGSGVGLSVCRSIVEQHGGEIWLAKSDDTGATFCFSIPRGAMDDPAISAEMREKLSLGRVRIMSSAG